MNKRPHEDDGQSSLVKRPKLQGTEEPESLQYAEQLRQLLTFRQDNINQQLSGVRRFISFLDSILYADEETSTTKEQRLLKDFLEQEIPSAEGDQPLKGLFQAWSLAVQLNHDYLSAAVPAVLALLLKTISNNHDLRDFGFLLCKVILQQSQLELISRNLLVAKEKEYIISPCLRLLTEITLFDAGTLTHRVHAARAFTLDGRILSRCLSLGFIQRKIPDEAQKRPTIRTHCVRYLLALLKFSSSQAKAGLIRDGAIFRAFFENISQDGLILLSDIFNTLKTCVLQDQSIPKHCKGYLLNDRSLSNIANLYKNEAFLNTGAAHLRRDVLAHDFLRFVCSRPDAGVLRQSSGFYPRGADRNDLNEDEQASDMIDLGLDSIQWYREYDKDIPVQNVPLSRFSKKLRPYLTNTERELLALIFDSAPELIADYFRNTSFMFDPKLSATWIGYSSFLFATIQTEVPRFFGNRDGYETFPPPTSILLESILPAPMNQKVMTKCLNQRSELITFSALKLLCAAFEKLRRVVQQFSEAIKIHGSLWQEGQQRLTDAFIQRCPSMKDLISTFRQTREENMIQREAALRLLHLCFEITPQLANEQKFDISLTLNRALQEFLQKTETGAKEKDSQEPPSNEPEGVPLDTLAGDDSKDSNTIASFGTLQLTHLLRIAALTFDVRWCSKPESLQFSPLVCLLKIYSYTSSSKTPKGIYGLLRTITRDIDIFQNSTTISGLDSLLASLRLTNEWHTRDDVLEWLDGVLQRYTRTPIKYLDDLDELCAQKDHKEGVLSPLWMALREQWPFAVERSKAKSLDTHLRIFGFLRCFQATSTSIGEDTTLIQDLMVDIESAVDSESNDLLPLASRKVQHVLGSVQKQHSPPQLGTNFKELVTTTPTTAPNFDPGAFAPEPLQSDAQPTTALHSPLKHEKSDLNDAINSGELSNLILCLSSSDRDVQQQALTNIRAFSKRLSERRIESHVPAAKQLWLLLGIVINTVAPRIEYTQRYTSSEEDQTTTAIPHIVPTFAAMSAIRLTQPRHILYEPINKYLLRGPILKEDKLLRYWLHITLRSPPPPSSSHSISKPPSTTTVTSTEETHIISLEPLPLTTLPPSRPFGGDAYHAQLHFLISILYHSTRTATDVDILHHNSAVIESLLVSCGSDVSLPRSLRELILALLWRIMAVEGGSDFLITRCGVVPWLAGMVATRGAGKGDSDVLGKAALKELCKRVWDTCDQQRVGEWGGDVEKIVERVAGDGEAGPTDEDNKPEEPAEAEYRDGS